MARRPPGMRTDVTAFDPRHDPGMAAVAFFTTSEEAIAAGREWVEPQGYRVQPQYFGRYDLWALEARRKTWRGAGILVEACRHPERVVVRHAHVPARYAFTDATIAQQNN